MKLLKNLSVLFTRKDALVFGAIFVLGFVLAVIEMIGIGGIIPFITLVQSPGYIEKIPFLWQLKNSLGILEIKTFTFLIGFALMGVFLLKGILGIFSVYWQNRFAYYKQIDLSTKLLESYLHSDYSFHVNNNSSVLLKNVNLETANIMFLIRNIIAIVTEGMILIALLSLVFLINVQIAIGLAVIFAAFYLLTTRMSGKSLKKLGYLRENINKEAYQQTAQALRAIKEIKIANLEDVYVQMYKKNIEPLVDLSSTYFVYQFSPPFIVQSMAFCGMIGFIMFNLFMGNVNSELIAIIMAYYFAGSRMLPSLSKIINSYMEMKFYVVSIEIVASQIMANKLRLASPGEDKNIELSAFRNAIELRDVCFSYSKNGNMILENVNMLFKREAKIIIAGPSGVGKSTLMDIIVCLLDPTRGNVFYDDFNLKDITKKSLSGLIAYIPQNVVLLDSDVVHNIAFGISEADIDYEKVRHSLKVARLEEYISDLKRHVGEGGVKLSGGQRQRIGIARALYKDSPIVVLDEVTSALDVAIEDAIMNDIMEIFKDKTVIMITHKMRLASYFDCVYTINNKTIQNV